MWFRLCLSVFYFILYFDLPLINSQYLDNSIDSPGYGFSSIIAPKPTNYGGDYYNHNSEYRNLDEIISTYLNNERSACLSESAILNGPLDQRDFMRANGYAKDQLNQLVNANIMYLQNDSRGLNFSNYVYQAGIQAKYNEFLTQYMAQSKCMSKYRLATEMPQISVPSSNRQVCSISDPRTPKVPCNPSSRYRTIDGTCNNLQNPNLASSLHCHRRLLPPDYSDGISQMRVSYDGSPLPSPRTVEQAAFPDLPNFDNQLDAFTTMWGQFIAHDVVRTLNFFGQALRCCDFIANRQPLHPECQPIINFTPDQFSRSFGATCINTIRSIACNTCRLGPRGQINAATALLDLSNIYGGNLLNNEQSVRSFTGGQLRGGQDFQGKPILPPAVPPRDNENLDLTACNPPIERPDLVCPHSGDGIRSSQNPAINSLSILAKRRHNQHADALAQVNPHWNDETLFQEARRILIAEINAIHFGEYLPAILGSKLTEYFRLNTLKEGYTIYDPTVDPSSINEFAVAAFRIGHTQTHSTFTVLPDQYRPYNFSLRDKFFRVDDILAGNAEGIIRGMLSDSAMVIDPFFVNDLKNFLFFNPRTPALISLPSINVNRGRDHGTAGYVYYLEYCTGVKVTQWEDLEKFIPKVQLDIIRSIYKHFQDVDLYVGGLSESHLGDARVGPTFGCLIGIQFHHWKFGDRFYFEHGGQAGSFQPDQLNNIRQVVSLANYICKTTLSESVQMRAMFLASQSNPNIYCNSLPEINYNLWKDTYNGYK